MKVSLEWLKEFVPIRLPLQKLSERMAMGGLEVVGVEKKGSDFLLEIEITPNRPDLLSHIGIAREIAALTGVRLKLPKIPYTVNRTPYTRNNPLKISIQDKKGCLRYIGRLFDHVAVGPTPLWMKERLERLGIRSVNNVVDITNYVLLEKGQPLHAFNYDRIEGGEVKIRAARQGETLITLDGITRTLQKEELVIADAKKPIALAGVIGGKETEITPSTKRILLESAYFDPIKVRRSSRRLALSTESSYRFERGVSLEGVQAGSDRASELLAKVAGAQLVSTLDRGKKSSPKKTISLSLQDLSETLGVSPGSSKVHSFLISLGCRVNAGKRLFRVTPPSFRKDLQEPVDLAEEIGRLLGYDQIPVTTALRERLFLGKTSEPLDALRLAEGRLKDLLISQGLFEAVTYSLLSRSLFKVFFGDENTEDTENTPLPIQNPISLEQELLRPSLLPRLAEVAAYNIHRKAEGVAIFEIGPVYEKEGAKYRERKKLGILLLGASPGNWKVKPSSYDYFDLKGKCEVLFQAFHPKIVWNTFARPFPFFENSSMALEIGGETVGFLGQLSSSVLGHFDLRGKAFAAEIDIEKFVRTSHFQRKFAFLPKHPSVKRDLALIADRSISSGELMSLLRKEGGELVRDIFLFDTYSDPRIVPQGFRGLAYRIEFSHPDRTLLDEEVNQAHQAIIEALKRRGVRIR